MYVGGYVKPANRKERRGDRRLVSNRNGKRRIVVVIRERNSRTISAVFESEAAATSFIKSRVKKGTVIRADEASSWNELHASYDVKRINHELAYSADHACTNGAEEFFSRMRWAEIGHHHHISGIYLDRYAKEAAFREDRRRQSNGEQFSRVMSLVSANGPSVDFCGYWQRSPRAI